MNENDMFYNNVVDEALELNSGQLKTLMFILDGIKKDKVHKASFFEISRALGISTYSTRTSVKALTDIGYIKVGPSAKYTLDVYYHIIEFYAPKFLIDPIKRDLFFKAIKNVIKYCPRKFSRVAKAKRSEILEKLTSLKEHND